MSQVICHQCGKAIEADSRFCLYCGAPQSATDAPGERPPAPLPGPVLPPAQDEPPTAGVAPSTSPWSTLAKSCLIYTLVTGCLGFVAVGIALSGSSFSTSFNNSPMWLLALACGPLSLSPFWFFWALWLWPLIDCVSHEPGSDNDKIVWLLVMLFTAIIGGTLYLFIRRPQRITKYGR